MVVFSFLVASGEGGESSRHKGVSKLEKNYVAGRDF